MPEPGTEIHSSVLELIGNTPMVRLPKLSAALGLPTALVMKMETTNPGGSAKDRPALQMIEAAERDGLLRPGGTIVEPTSGNTGIGLAIAAAQKGYRCVFVMTDKVAPEKVSLLRAYGADVVVCPVAVAPDDPASYYSTAKRLVQEIPGAYRPNQYDNPYNATAHYNSTGPEIWRQSAGRVTHFVASMGTCGTITGVARYLKEQNPNIRIIGADPVGSVFSGGSGRPYLVEGIGEDFFPAAFDRSLYNDIIAVSDADSFAMARRVTREEGIIVGGSGGTAVAAAVQVARAANPGDLVVVLNPDSGRGYLSKVFDDGWMASYGFVQECERCVQQLIDTRSDAVPDLVYVNPDHTVRHAISLMRKHEVSQLIVAKNEPPFAAAEVSGAVDELHLMDAVFKDPDALQRPIGEVMGPKLPTVGGGQSMDLLVDLLDSAPAVMVLSGGRPLCVLSRQDVLRFLSPVDG